MADNSTLPATGDVIRDKDRAGVKTQIVGIDLNPSGSETLMAGVMPVSVNSNGYCSQPTVTRPTNTNVYAAGDVVGGVIDFTSAGPSGGHLLITTASLRVNITSVPTGMTSFRLHLYSTTPTSALSDNAAWLLDDVDTGYLGYVDLGIPADLGDCLWTQVTSPGLQVKLASSSTTLYGYLQTIGGFTPAANSEVYIPTINGVGV